MGSLSIPSFLRDDDFAARERVDVLFGLKELDSIMFGFGGRGVGRDVG